MSLETNKNLQKKEGVLPPVHPSDGAPSNANAKPVPKKSGDLSACPRCAVPLSQEGNAVICVQCGYLKFTEAAGAKYQPYTPSKGDKREVEQQAVSTEAREVFPCPTCKVDVEADYLGYLFCRWCGWDEVKHGFTFPVPYSPPNIPSNHVEPCPKCDEPLQLDGKSLLYCSCGWNEETGDWQVPGAPEPGTWNLPREGWYSYRSRTNG